MITIFTTIFLLTANANSDSLSHLQEKESQLREQIQVFQSQASEINRKIIKLSTKLNTQIEIGVLEKSTERITMKTQMSKLEDDRGDLILQIAFLQSEHERVVDQINDVKGRYPASQ